MHKNTVSIHFLFRDTIRIYEDNDWVIFVILACAFASIAIFSFLRMSMWEYLRQELVISANNLLSWVAGSGVFVVLCSVLISQYIPVLPREIEERHIGGFTLNKFGYTLVVVALYYFVRIVITYFYYQSVGATHRWAAFYFSASKLYWVSALLLMAICFANEYYPIDKSVAFPLYCGLSVLFVCAKNAYYLFQKPAILPKEWFYKFLYICTLQIAPILVVLKLLFIIP